MKKLRLRIFVAILIIGAMYRNVDAQTSTQTVRGTIVDKISQSPMPGVSVIVLNTSPIIATTTDANGDFKLLNVPVGKQSIRVSFISYKEIVLHDISINSGKELVLLLGMEEDAAVMKEVEIKAKVEKNKPLNYMSVVSDRTFSVEETQKFAAAVNDPARMATSFAGVVSGDDGNNSISIRGNSPNGLLWRMEGIEIPNPNHFSNAGSSGGGVSILSAQVLTNSDFSTGAFAAEYGNAISGVFDLKLRKGNNQKKEYTAQLGLLGADLAAEGPFTKNYEGSYLVNYRYSTLSLLDKLGIKLIDAVTDFQDLSYNISLPTSKMGIFTLFGFGGLSNQVSEAKKDSLQWAQNDYYRLNTHFYSNTGATGVTNTYLFGNQSYLKTALLFSEMDHGYEEAKMQYDYKTITKEYEEKYNQGKITLSSVYTKKINAKSNIRTGVILDQIGYSLHQKSKTDTTALADKINAKGNTQMIQAFLQWNYKLTDKITANAGIHYLQLILNNSNSIEPRMSLKYELSARHTLSLGYGLHSQIQPIGIYFSQQPLAQGYLYPNKNLGLSKAHHLVAGYDFNINEYSHIKTEVYYQYLFNVPISTDKTNTYSILNSLDGYYTDALVNKGLGINKGVELAYERFLHNNLYYLLSASLFDSKYKAADNHWYNTRFNTNYALVFTIGKEWTLSEKRKSRVLGFNIKSMYVGGLRYTPIDLKASIAEGSVQFNIAKTYAEKNPDYYRLDLRVSLKRNYKKMTSTLALDVQNASNHKNVGGEYFDLKSGTIKYFYQSPIIPILSYKLEF